MSRFEIYDGQAKLVSTHRTRNETAEAVRGILNEGRRPLPLVTVDTEEPPAKPGVCRTPKPKRNPPNV